MALEQGGHSCAPSGVDELKRLVARWLVSDAARGAKVGGAASDLDLVAHVRRDMGGRSLAVVAKEVLETGTLASRGGPHTNVAAAEIFHVDILTWRTLFDAQGRPVRGRYRLA